VARRETLPARPCGTPPDAARREPTGTLTRVTRRQRSVLVGLGAAVGTLAVVLGVVALVGRDHVASVGATTTLPVASVSTLPASVTTLQLLPVVPTSPPTTLPSVPSTTPPSTEPSTTTTSTVPPVLNGSGAILAAPSSPDQRVEAPGVGCASLADTGWGGVQCGVAPARGGMLTWLTETRPVGPAAAASRAYVFGPANADRSLPVLLEAFDDTGSRFASIHVRVDSVEGAGADLAFGFRDQGSADLLSLDLVGGPGRVAVHQDLYRGVARTGTGQLDTWSAVLAAGDSNGPSSYQHDTIKYVGGAWRLVSQEAVPPSSVPPSQL